MELKRTIGGSVLAAGVGLAGVLGVGLGVGLGTAAADPGPPCGAPGGPQCGHPAPPPPGQRGIEQGRQDHQPFTYQGRQVVPMPAGNGHGWGFWFLGRWIPL